MAYTVSQLAKLAGVSARTLRYYDEINLLSPQRLSGSGYRVYTNAEVDRLQQILLYRELEIPLDEIADILNGRGGDAAAALRAYHEQLKQKQQQLNTLLKTVEKTILYMEGEIEMQDKEKFEGFKKELVQENEAKYGAEIRQKYGDETVDESNRKMLNLTKEQYDEMQALAAEIQSGLAAAVTAGEDPAGARGQELAAMHRKWLSFSWNSYSAQAHKGLALMYIADERFTQYYDAQVQGCAQFLHDAIEIMCS